MGLRQFRLNGGLAASARAWTVCGGGSDDGGASIGDATSGRTTYFLSNAGQNEHLDPQRN